MSTPSFGCAIKERSVVMTCPRDLTPSRGPAEGTPRFNFKLYIYIYIADIAINYCVLASACEFLRGHIEVLMSKALRVPESIEIEMLE